MEIDHEYLKRLEDDIVKSVEKRLFRYYLAMGGVVAALLGFVGYSVFDSLEETAKDLAQNAAAPAIADAELAVKQAITSANFAKTTADTAALRIEGVDDYLERREDILLSVQRDTSAQRRIAEKMQLETQEFFKETRSKSEELNKTRQELSERFAELNKNLSDYQTRTEAFGIELNKLASAGDLETVANTVDLLGTQLAAMNDQLNELTQKASTTEALVQEGADSQVIQGAVAGVAPEKSNPVNDTTVYFQFAGSTRKLAEAISSRLEANNYVIPEEERTSIAAGMHEIRFFFTEDQERASRLQEDINEILLVMGLASNVSVRDFSDYQSAKPRRGTLELWLEPVPL